MQCTMTVNHFHAYLCNVANVVCLSIGRRLPYFLLSRWRQVRLRTDQAVDPRISGLPWNSSPCGIAPWKSYVTRQICQQFNRAKSPTWIWRFRRGDGSPHMLPSLEREVTHTFQIRPVHGGPLQNDKYIPNPAKSGLSSFP